MPSAHQKHTVCAVFSSQFYSYDSDIVIALSHRRDCCFKQGHTGGNSLLGWDEQLHTWSFLRKQRRLWRSSNLHDFGVDLCQRKFLNLVSSPVRHFFLLITTLFPLRCLCSSAWVTVAWGMSSRHLLAVNPRQFSSQMGFIRHGCLVWTLYVTAGKIQAMFEWIYSCRRGVKITTCKHGHKSRNAFFFPMTTTWIIKPCLYINFALLTWC